MFVCQACQCQEFKLALQPGFAGQVTSQTNAHGDVEIYTGEKTFIADLWFMNQFAVCKQCDAIGSWAYFYPEIKEA